MTTTWSRSARCSAEGEPGTSYGSRDNGLPATVLHDIPADQIPSLPNTPSSAPMPNFPITDIPGANSAVPTTGVTERRFSRGWAPDVLPGGPREFNMTRRAAVRTYRRYRASRF